LPSYFVFFFSSRRRHTRSKRDWSSDVCSSDLEPSASESITSSEVPTPSSSVTPSSSSVSPESMILTNDFYSMNQAQITAKLQEIGVGGVIQMQFYNTVPAGQVRSEERRVGKECSTDRASSP